MPRKCWFIKLKWFLKSSWIFFYCKSWEKSIYLCGFFFWLYYFSENDKNKSIFFFSFYVFFTFRRTQKLEFFILIDIIVGSFFIFAVKNFNSLISNNDSVVEWVVIRCTDYTTRNMLNPQRNLLYENNFLYKSGKIKIKLFLKFDMKISWNVFWFLVVLYRP